MHIAANPYFNPECECLAVLLYGGKVLLTAEDKTEACSLPAQKLRTQFTPVSYLPPTQRPAQPLN
jgi:hypothetical protein